MKKDVTYDLQIKPGPQYYAYGEGEIDKIPSLLKEYGVKKVLILHGDISWRIAKPYLKVLFESENEFFFEQYRGECTFEEGEHIAEIIAKSQVDFVIGVGGGKLCDVTILATSKLMVPFGIIPTLASNCAPWAAVSVMYKRDGTSEGISLHYNHNAAFLVTDPRLIVTTPLRYFISGMADTIVKWYEADLITAQDELKDYPLIKMGRYAAQLCKETILTYGDQAIESLKEGEPSKAFYLVSEAIMTVGGLLGGMSGKYGRYTAAHTVHDALSAYVPEILDYIHGEKVAYGILFQLALEDNWAEIDKLMPIYQRWNLPISLHQMGVYSSFEDRKKEIISYIVKEKNIQRLPLVINEEVVEHTFEALENYLSV